VSDVIEKHVMSASITKDVSIYFYDLKQKILKGSLSNDSYLVPSVIIKAVIEAYNDGEYKLVINICDKVLNDQHNLYTEVSRELTYWLCLSLCRLVKDDERNKERFWELIKVIGGADKAFLKGFFFRYDEQYPKAESCFMDALKMSPNMDRAKRELVTVLLAQGKYSDALDLAKENYERSKENSYHIYAYFRCLVRKNGLKHDEIEILDNLMNDVQENYSDKKDELLASMKIEYAYYVERQSPTYMLDMIKQSKKDFPKSVHVERVIKEYKRRQGF
jgi:tetratricopeptide (TPR) repeat protein